MGGRKILITVTEEQHKALQKMATERGLVRVSVLAKSEVLKSVQGSLDPRDDEKTLAVDVTNYRELSDYVSCKKFGSIESFATFAMEQYMTKYPAKSRKTPGTEN